MIQCAREERAEQKQQRGRVEEKVHLQGKDQKSL